MSRNRRKKKKQETEQAKQQQEEQQAAEPEKKEIEASDSMPESDSAEQTQAEEAQQSGQEEASPKAELPVEPAQDPSQPEEKPEDVPQAEPEQEPTGEASTQTQEEAGTPEAEEKPASVSPAPEQPEETAEESESVPQKQDSEQSTEPESERESEPKFELEREPEAKTETSLEIESGSAIETNPEHELAAESNPVPQPEQEGAPPLLMPQEPALPVLPLSKEEAPDPQEEPAPPLSKKEQRKARKQAKKDAKGKKETAPVPSPLVQGAHKSAARRFFETVAGFVLLIGLLGGVIAAGLFTPGWLTTDNMNTLFRSFFVMGPFAVAMALTARAGGGDLSMPGLAVLASFLVVEGGGMARGIALAAGLGLAVGLVNGILCYGLKVPSFLATLVTGQVCLWGATLLSGGKILRFEGLRDMPFAYFGFLFVIALAVGACFLFFTAAGVPFEERTPKQRRSGALFFAYPLGGVLAALGGVQFAMLNARFVPGEVPITVVELAFLWAILAASRFWDNEKAPVFISLLGLLILSAGENILVLREVAPALIDLAKGALAVVTLLVAGIARWPFFRHEPVRYGKG